MKMTKGIRMCKIRADLPVTKKTQSEKIIIQEYRKQFSTYETELRESYHVRMQNTGKKFSKRKKRINCGSSVLKNIQDKRLTQMKYFLL